VSIAESLATVRARIAAAAARSGRDASLVTLVAVSKTFGVDAVRAAWSAGQRDFGENRVQEALQKIGDASDLPIRWHLIGHLQSNKARKAVPAFAAIQSVDSLELFEKLEQAAQALPRGTAAPQILVQVDLAGEATKFGAPPEEAERIVRAAADSTALGLTGLMLVPPWNEDPEKTRPWFIALRRFRDTLVERGIALERLRDLSMGMSHDYEAAIEEGSTIVRVGTAIFGKREARN
jgi:pyridoxal phosphate enzyme (YggS family)